MNVSATTVAPSQRFTKRTQDCPVCGGNRDDRRHRSERCWGYISEDGRWVRCTREEYGGALQPNDRGEYVHLLDGPCRCGETHRPGTRPALPKALPPPPKPQRGPFPATLDGAHLAATFDYHDATGHRLYTILRCEWPIEPGEAKPDKTFRQVRWLDEGTWAWGLGGTVRVLYHLCEMLAAAPHRTIFVVEGEKAANALIAQGLLATTCSEGAEKWQQVPSRHEVLRGRHVVILPDHDEKGRRHAQQVAADLAGVAASVRVLDLPDLPKQGDVVEWLNAGGTKYELFELAIGAPVWKPSTDPDPDSGGGKPGASTASTDGEDELALRREVRRLRQENTTLTDRLHREQETRTLAEQRVRNLEHEMAMIHQIMAVPNQNMGAPQKLAAIAVRAELSRVPRERAAAKVQVYRAAFAVRLGVSEQRAGALLKDLGELKVIDREVQHDFDDAQILISRGPKWDTPKDIAPERPGNAWGGDRRHICAACGSTNVYVKTDHVCHDCGHIEHIVDRPLNPPKTSP